MLVSEAAVRLCFRSKIMFQESLQHSFADSFAKNNLNVGNFFQHLQLFCKTLVYGCSKTNHIHHFKYCFSLLCMHLSATTLWLSF